MKKTFKKVISIAALSIASNLLVDYLTEAIIAHTATGPIFPVALSHRPTFGMNDIFRNR